MPTKFSRDRKKKRLGGKSNDSGKGSIDPNALEIIPLPRSEKEKKKKELREQLRAQQPKISSQKQKRLDKYIVIHFKMLSCFSSFA